MAYRQNAPNCDPLKYTVHMKGKMNYVIHIVYCDCIFLFFFTPEHREWK